MFSQETFSTRNTYNVKDNLDFSKPYLNYEFKYLS